MTSLSFSYCSALFCILFGKKGMDMKKVMMFSSVHPYDDSRIFHKEAVSLVKAGYQVELHAVADFEHKEEQGVQIFGIKRRSRWKRIMNGYELYQRALKSDADLFHFHDPELLPWGYLIHRKTGKPVIYDAHEDLPKQIHTKPWIPVPLRGIVSKIVKIVEKGFAKRLTAVVTVVESIEEQFRKGGAKRVQLIKNYPLFVPGVERVDDGVNRILYVGGISYLRGYQEMIRMMDYLPEHLNAELHLIGPLQFIKEEDRDEEKFRQKKIYLHGRISFREVQQWYAKGKIGLVCLHPVENYLHALPIKLFEYMSMGLPQIVTDIPMWKEIVESNHTGLTVDALNPKAIAEKVTRILEDEELYQKLSENSRKAFEETYNWQREEKRLIQLYEELLHEH